MKKIAAKVFEFFFVRPGRVGVGFGFGVVGTKILPFFTLLRRPGNYFGSLSATAAVVAGCAIKFGRNSNWVSIRMDEVGIHGGNCVNGGRGP